MTGFDEVAFESPDDAGFVGVGVHRMRRAPMPWERDVRLFTFTGDGRVH